MDYIRTRCGDPNLARNVDHRIGPKLAPSRIFVQRSALGLERGQHGQVETVFVDDRAARITGGDEHRPFLGEEARGMLADRAEALDHDSRTGELQLDMVPRYVDCADKTKTGGADLVERDAADLARQPDGAADLVLDPPHGQLVCAHVRSEEHTSELQSHVNLVCRLLLEKKKK